MKLLAIDTATEACSAAIVIGEDIRHRYQLAPRQHAELILPMVDELLAEAGARLADLDALVFGRGPGAFTGVRIAAGVIQGLALGADLPVIPVSTLAALAQGTKPQHRYIISAIDARMGEIYWGVYERKNGLVTAIGDEAVSRPEDLTVPAHASYYGTGTGWQTYHPVLRERLREQLSGYDGHCYPHARDMLTLATPEFKAGRMVSAEQALPVYLRNKVTQ